MTWIGMRAKVGCVLLSGCESTLNWFIENSVITNGISSTQGVDWTVEADSSHRPSAESIEIYRPIRTR